MPVVINEFEVIPAPASGEPEAGAERPAAPAGSTPEDIEQVVRRMRERAMRVRAH